LNDDDHFQESDELKMLQKVFRDKLYELRANHRILHVENPDARFPIIPLNLRNFEGLQIFTEETPEGSRYQFRC